MQRTDDNAVRASLAKRPRFASSVFVKLVLLLLLTGAILIGMVSVFFGVIVNRDYSIAVHRMVKDYAVTTAASGPDLATAERLRDRLGFDVRYEGPAGSWTTSSELPTIDAVRAGAGPRTTTLFGHLLLVETGNYQIVEAPDGGAYLFSWTVGRRLNAVHLKLLALLAVFVLGVLLISYAVLRHLMRPLRTLGDGVARLGAGELDVVVPQRSRDEFGALTAAFNQMVRRVRDMIGARDQLLLDVSHELRSPLTRLKLDLEMLPESVQRARMGSDVVEMEAMLAELLELERLRMLDGVPISLDNNRVPLRFLPPPAELDFSTDSLYAALERAGHPLARGDYELEARAAGAGEAALLGLAQGTPVLFAITVAIGEDGRVVDLGRTVYRADRYRFQATLMRRTPKERGRETDHEEPLAQRGRAARAGDRDRRVRWDTGAGQAVGAEGRHAG